MTYQDGSRNQMTQLALIAEAVKYCQRVKAMGMPAACYSKALREPVYFLWERRNGGKSRAKFRSRAAQGLNFGKREIVYDHAIPFRYIEAELLDLAEVTPQAVADVLEKKCVVALITTEEDRKLNAAGLSSKMPENWDGLDPLARYKAVGIDLVPGNERC